MNFNAKVGPSAVPQTDGIPLVYSVQEVNSLKQSGVAAAPKGARDLLFGILFVLNFLGFIGLTAYGGKQYADRMSSMKNGTLADAGVTMLDTVELLDIGGSVAIAAGVATVFSILWLFLARRFARALIYATIVGNILVYFALAGLWAWFATSQKGDNGSLIYGSIVFGVVGLLHCCLFFLWRRRIPFAAAMLSTVSKVTMQYGGTVFASFFSLIPVLGWAALWSYSIVVNFTWMQAALNNGTGSAGLYGIYVYMLFTFYWTQQVIQNTIFVTISGTFASWYFLGGNRAAMPSNPTAKSAKRALTTSFGSIALGSLLVAILQTIRAIVRSMRSRRNALLICLIECLLSCIETLVRMFNKYAFVVVAIWGKTYCGAAKDTVRLIGSHGISAIINDCIVNNVLSFGCLFGAILGLGTGALGGLVIIGTGTAAGAWILLVPALLGFFIGFVVMAQTMMVIDAGVATIFVAFAVEPATLAGNDPELAQHFQAAQNLI